MKLFGRKRKSYDRKKNFGSAKRKKKKNIGLKKYKNPSDVKLFYRMPLFLVLGAFSILLGVVIGQSNITAYRREILTHSMAKGEELKIREGNSEGELTLGNTLLSKDGKTLVAEIQYDTSAHQQLSSFGTNYNLYLIDTEKYVMQDVQVSYGMFETDGSGILTLYSEKGFEDRAFMVFILDKGQLVSSSDLMTSTYLTDDEIDRSLAAQLAQLDKVTDEKATKEDNELLPPTYIVRLNAFSAEKALRNWNNDGEMLEDLIVDKNLQKLNTEKEKLADKQEVGKHTLEEMEKRIKENPKDETAKSSITDLNNSLKKIESEISKIENKIAELNRSYISSDSLEPKQTKFEKFTVLDLDRVK